MDDDETLIVAGLHIDRHLLDVQPVRRCDIASCLGACCSNGVLLVTEQKSKILQHAHLIKPCLPADRQDEGLWFEGHIREEPGFPSGPYDATSTFPKIDNPQDRACIFLLPDARCALQKAAITNSLPQWMLKPFYCAIYPLILEQGCLKLDDENPLYQKDACRRCAANTSEPLYVAMKSEFIYVLGESGYLQLSRSDHSHHVRHS
jgi:hypothetical protein